MPLVWHTKSFTQLNTDELFDILVLRQSIFVVEQECAYPDIDQVDKVALHLFAYSGDQLAAYARLIKPGVTYEFASIGRVAVAPQFRSAGYGRVLMQQAIAKMTALYPAQKIKIGAQHRLEKFYNNLGFETVSEAYLEDGIPHIDMLSQLD